MFQLLIWTHHQIVFSVSFIKGYSLPSSRKGLHGCWKLLHDAPYKYQQP